MTHMVASLIKRRLYRRDRNALRIANLFYQEISPVLGTSQLFRSVFFLYLANLFNSCRFHGLTQETIRVLHKRSGLIHIEIDIGNVNHFFDQFRSGADRKTT
ncbi:MAG: hypothetical protein JW395_0807 [Nitrospira sp.]|nr:hypothetical protein [Nitrospira sp.]